MITTITQEVRTSINHVVCPFCYADISFLYAPPPHCVKCLEELPPWHDLIENIEERIDYHTKHPCWDYTD